MHSKNNISSKIAIVSREDFFKTVMVYPPQKNNEHRIIAFYYIIYSNALQEILRIFLDIFDFFEKSQEITQINQNLHKVITTGRAGGLH